MDIGRALKIRDELIREYKDIYSRAKTFRMTASQMYELKLQADRRKPNDTPKWVFEYARGYYACIIDIIFQTEVEFCYVTSTGMVLSTYRGSPRYYEDMGFEPHDMCGLSNAHFWKGSDKPFTEVSKI